MCFLSKTMATDPSWPTRLYRINRQAAKYEHLQDMERYSACSFHWVHIRIPSSKNVDTRQNLAMCGNVVFEWDRAFSTANSRDILMYSL